MGAGGSGVTLRTGCGGQGGEDGSGWATEDSSKRRRSTRLLLTPSSEGMGEGGRG